MRFFKIKKLNNWIILLVDICKVITTQSQIKFKSAVSIILWLTTTKSGILTLFLSFNLSLINSSINYYTWSIWVGHCWC